MCGDSPSIYSDLVILQYRNTAIVYCIICIYPLKWCITVLQL